MLNKQTNTKNTAASGIIEKQSGRQETLKRRLKRALQAETV